MSRAYWTLYDSESRFSISEFSGYHCNFQEDLNAPIYLLGLTITAGALVSIPFLYYSHYIVDKCGMVNIIIVALLMYGVR